MRIPVDPWILGMNLSESICSIGASGADPRDGLGRSNDEIRASGAPIRKSLFSVETLDLDLRNESIWIYFSGHFVLKLPGWSNTLDAEGSADMIMIKMMMMMMMMMMTLMMLIIIVMRMMTMMITMVTIMMRMIMTIIMTMSSL